MQYFDRWISHAYFYLSCVFLFHKALRSLFATIRTIPTIRYSLFVIIRCSLFATIHCSRFAIRDYSLFAIRVFQTPVRKIVQNVLDEPISQETEKRLQKPLLPKPYQPRPPPRQRKARKMEELLRRYDVYPAQKIRTVTDYQNEILDLFDYARYKGEESKRRRYIRWRFIRGLEKDLTPNFMEKIRRNVGTSFYLRHVFTYKLRNIEDGTVIVYYTNHVSHWMQKLSEAEKWLSEEETKRLDSAKIERS